MIQLSQLRTQLNQIITKLELKKLFQILKSKISLLCWVVPGTLFTILFLSAAFFILGKSFLEYPVLGEIAAWMLSDPFMARANLAFRANDVLLMSMFVLGWLGWMAQGLFSFSAKFRNQSRAGFCLGLVGFFCLSYIYAFRDLLWFEADPTLKLGFFCLPFIALGLMGLSYLKLPWEARLRQDLLQSLELIRVGAAELSSKAQRLISSARFQGLEDPEFYAELESMLAQLQDLNSAQDQLLELNLSSKLDPSSGVAKSRRMIAQLEGIRAKLAQLESGMESILDSEAARTISEIQQLLNQFKDSKLRDLLLRYYCSDRAWELLRKLKLLE